jgi:hypothetical protein
MKTKKYLLIITCVFFQFKTNAQDLIVLKSNDSLNCKILKENNDKYVEVAILVDKNIEIGSINLSEIANVRKEFFVNKNKPKTDCFDSIFTNNGELIIGKITEDKKDWYIIYELPNKSKNNIAYSNLKNVIKCNFISQKNIEKVLPIKKLQTNNNESINKIFQNKKYRFAFDGILGIYSGFKSSNFISTPKDYESQLRINLGITSSFHRSINRRRNVLLGVKFSSLYASANAQNAQIISPDSNLYFGEFETKLYLNTIGPNLLIKLGKEKSLHSYVLQFGLSFSYYNQITSISNYNLELSGVAFSPSLHFLYDYKMSKNFSLGTNLGYEGGALSSVLVNDNGNQSIKRLGRTNPIKLGRIGLSIGVRYWF